MQLSAGALPSSLLEEFLLFSWLVTFKDGADVLPDGYGSNPVELPEGQLHVEKGHPSEDGHQHVGDEEGSWESKGVWRVGVQHPLFSLSLAWRKS